MKLIGNLGPTLFSAGFAGFVLFLSGNIWALTTTGRLDVTDAAHEELRAEGRACVTVQDGGRVAAFHGTGESFTAVQTGGLVNSLKVSDTATAHVCGGTVRELLVEPGATVRLTGGTIESTTIKSGGCLHVYGMRLARNDNEITGRWLDRTPLHLVIPAASEDVILHDSYRESLPEMGPYAHYRLDESGTLQAYDGTTFLHHAAGGDFVTTVPAGAPLPSFESPSVTNGMPPLIGQGYSTRMAGGASATIPGTKLPDLDEGATISFWFRLHAASEPGVNSLMSKAVAAQHGHPRSMALCLMGGRDLIWVSDGGAAGGSTLISPGDIYHIVLTFTPENQRVTGTMYVNGIPSGVGTGGAIDTPEMDFNIGGWAGGEAGADAYLDDVQIYDRPLSQEEVNLLYANPGTTLTDLDGDSMLDDVEYSTFGTLAQNPGDDYDQDGLSNEAELNHTRTDPGSYGSRLSILRFTSEGNAHAVLFSSVPGVRYQLEFSPDGRQWNGVGPIVPAEDSRHRLSHTANTATGFFRVATR